MCGICGQIRLAPGAASVAMPVDGMLESLTHRGPDERGAWEADGVSLAMRRLRIIDLGTGQQPMPNEDGTCWIVYNGETYNFMDLRRELEGRGHRFRTRSDTEAVLHAYEEWGADCVRRLRGMFAFAIHDGRSSSSPGRLFLARDRVGEKPLYYYRDARQLVFASEISALLLHPAVPRRVNRRMLPLYLACGYVPAPHTMFEDIHELPPGHTLTVANGEVSVAEYWDVTYAADAVEHSSVRDIAERVRHLLEEAVRIRLISEVPLGAFLSGGIDSTAIVALMARFMDQPVKTFAIGFADDPSFDELAYARLAARAYGTDHHEFVVRPDAAGLLPELVRHYGQPFGDSSAIPMYLVSKQTRAHVTVALAGDGGDELFAGYTRFAAARVAEAYRRAPHILHAAIAALLGALPDSTRYDGVVRRVRRFVESAPLPLVEGYLGWAGVFQRPFIREVMLDAPQTDALEHFQAFVARVRQADPIGRLLYLNTKTYLPGDLLVKADRMSMANSLEVRSPFLDTELIEFAARIPSNLKLRGLTMKYILKRSVKGIVPREIVHRKKHGFGVPIGRWFRDDLRPLVRDTVLSRRAAERGYFRPDVLRRVVEEHETGRRDHGHRLWTLLTLEVWHQMFIDESARPRTAPYLGAGSPGAGS